MDIHTGTALNLTSGNPNGLDQMADWSPDGSAIVYSSASTNDLAATDLHLMTVDATGSAVSDESILPGHPGPDLYPAMSPDGQKIAFTCHDGSDICVTYYVATPGGATAGYWTAPLPLTFDLPPLGIWFLDVRPSWSPNSQEIIFRRLCVGPGCLPNARQRDLYKVDISGYPPPPFGILPPPPAVNVTATLDINEDNPSWKPTPMGNTDIVFNVITETNKGEVNNIYSLTMGSTPALNSAPVQLTKTETADYPSWSPLGDEILYVREAGGDLDAFLMSADGRGKHENLTSTATTWEIWAKLRPDLPILP